MWLAGLCLAGMVLGSIQSRFNAAGLADPVGRLTQILVLPVSARIGNTLDASHDFVVGVLGARALVEQNRGLRAMAASAQQYSQRLAVLGQEVDELRKLIKLPPVPGRTPVPAQVVGFFPSDHRITLSVGATSGVKQGMPVVTGDGLLGIVQAVSPSNSQVTLLTSPFLRVGAITLRDPPSAGLLRGESSDMVVLEFLDIGAPVEIGNVVVTSGFSERVPRGIPIGRIVQYEDNKEFGTRRSRVFPYVHIGVVREVQVLR